MKYQKPPLSIEGQIKLLSERGLIISDKEKASHYLSNISYYRLRAYTYPFQDNRNLNHPFHKGVTFDNILDLYIFDRELRLLVFDAIERIEIALRTQIVHQFSLGYGSHWHEAPSLYNNINHFVRDMYTLQKEVGRSSEVFIKHYRKKYKNPLNPPVWMCLEVASMGLLSKIYENLKMNSEKKEIARHFGLAHPFVLESWMHSLSNVRNICAHHGRLWNRRLVKAPKLPKRTLNTWLGSQPADAQKSYTVLSCILYIMNIISPGHEWKTRLKQLLGESPSVSLTEMGFPENWIEEKLWK